MREGLNRYQPNVVSAAFHRHNEIQGALHKKLIYVVDVSVTDKYMLLYAAANTVVCDTLPLNFTYNKGGFTDISKVLLPIGQSYPTAVNINLKKLLPCPAPVRGGVLSLPSKCRENAKGELSNILHMGGGVSCDGVKVALTNKKYYDFVISYICVRRRSFGTWWWAGLDTTNPGIVSGASQWR